MFQHVGRTQQLSLSPGHRDGSTSPGRNAHPNVCWATGSEERGQVINGAKARLINEGLMTLLFRMTHAQGFTVAVPLPEPKGQS